MAMTSRSTGGGESVGPERRPFGTWPSPVDAELASVGELRLGEVRADGSDLYWIEGRPDEAGRSTLMRRRHGETEELTPAPFNPRSRVHEYGGGAFCVAPGTDAAAGRVFFVHFADQNLYEAGHGDEPRRVTDGVWLPQAPWGARTPAFVSARGTGLEGYGEHERSVAFLYLRASSRRRPARLEFPRWVVEADRTEWMTDVVRAEIVAQADGYPYAAETADALAVLTQADRDRFHALFQEFADRNGLDAYLSGKSASKRRRR